MWTYGFAGWTLGTLNILTAFVGTILLGVGIDVGIHVLDRAEQERSRGGLEAIRTALGRTGEAAAIASLTTVAGFASLSLSDFRVFREFSIISSSGLLLVLTSYLLCLPVLLSLRDRVQGEKLAKARAHFPAAHSILRFSPWAFWLCTVAIFGTLTWISSARFNYDFGSLETRNLPSYQLDRDVNELLGHSQTPLTLMTRDGEEARTAAIALRQRSAEKGVESGIDRVTTSAELVPGDQEAKAAILAKLAKTLLLIEPESLEEHERKQRADLEERVAAPAFAEADLPPSVRRAFHAMDGSGEFVLVLPGISLTDGEKIRGLAEELRDIPTGVGASSPTLSATGEAMVLGPAALPRRPLPLA
ncbi:MAG: MMPL family transporter [Myxococcales bacterium]|nr:MMPL family transporter [Myxococcales bacterium]